MSDSESAFNALLDLCETIVLCLDPVDGTPSGTLYAALMPAGCTLQQYQWIIGGLERAGRIRREGDLLFPVAREGVQHAES